MEAETTHKGHTSSVYQKVISRYDGHPSDDEADKPKTLPLQAPLEAQRPSESERKIRVSSDTLNLDAKNLKFYQVMPAKTIREDTKSTIL